MVSYQCEWIQEKLIYNIGKHFLLFGPFRSYEFQKKSRIWNLCKNKWKNDWFEKKKITWKKFNTVIYAII